MKRTELKRTGFKRKPGNSLKRTPLRRRSKKKEREIAKTRQPRKLYLEAHPECMVRGPECEGAAVEVHEIPRGGSRQQSVADADCWLTTCRPCHDNELGDYDRWPPEKQAALKLLRTLQTINTIRSGLPQIRLTEVVRALKRLATRER